jgi:hypothetical protein
VSTRALPRPDGAIVERAEPERIFAALQRLETQRLLRRLRL